MKLARTHSLLLATITLATGILIGCSGTSTAAIEARDPRLVGDWLITAIKTSDPSAGPLDCQPDGARIDLGELGGVACGSTDEYEFESNGSFTARKGGEVATGTWSTGDNVVTVITADQGTLAASYAFTGNDLELSFKESPNTATSTFILQPIVE
jgi:hypothetical protein